MSKLIKNGTVSDNPWKLVRELESLENTDFGAGHWLVPLDAYESVKESATVPHSQLGVWLGANVKLEDLAPYINQVPLVCIDFPAFADGRGFSNARTLRDYYEYSGELRAIGNFIQDQMYYLQRCGFDAFEIADEWDMEAVRQSLADFSVSYQAAVDEAQPLFRRRS